MVNVNNKNRIRITIYPSFIVLWFFISGFQFYRNISPEVLVLEQMYCGLIHTERTKTVNYPGVPKGYLHFETNFRMLKETDTIEAKIGANFGVYYIIYSYALNRIPIRYVWTFPEPMIDEKGEKFEKKEYILYETLNSTSWENYILENEWELIKGEWKFQMYYKDEMFYEKSFYLK